LPQPRGGLIDDAGGEIERVLASRAKLPSLSVTSRRLLARAQRP
jgi:hypothetical protein